VTFQTAAYAVDGNAESGNFLRLMLQSATMGAQGIVGATDLLVTANSPATAGIIIAGGACVVLGVETPFQGSYYGYNVGNDTSLSIAATGGTARSDMVVVRAEDPTWSGSPWGNPASGQILFPRVISNVSAGATSPPAGISAIPLARIDMPASQSVVQASYIHDLRQVANPQRILSMGAANGPGTAQNWTVGTSGVIWPTTATFSIPIPSWATVMQFQWEMNDLLWQSGWARGFINPFFGTNVAAPNLTMPQVLVSIPSATGPWRHSVTGAFSISVPASLRGTTQTLNFKQVTDGTQTGVLAADEGSSYAIMYEFQQLASAS
jgi:hypothetical protein